MNKKRKEALNLAMREMDCIVDQFAQAMKDADVEHIARTGRQTPQQAYLWNCYVELAERWPK